jgi:hypothetical protein
MKMKNDHDLKKIVKKGNFSVVRPSVVEHHRRRPNWTTPTFT